MVNSNVKDPNYNASVQKRDKFVDCIVGRDNDGYLQGGTFAPDMPEEKTCGCGVRINIFVQDIFVSKSILR